MATLTERILEPIGCEPVSDDVLAKRLGVGHRQAVNRVTRRLEARQHVRRLVGPEATIIRTLTDGDGDGAVLESAGASRAAMVSGGIDGRSLLRSRRNMHSPAPHQAAPAL